MKPLQDFDRRLMWVLAAIFTAVLPHLLHLPLWVSLLVGTTLAWRLLACLFSKGLMPRSLRLALAVATVAGVFASYGTINGLDAGSALVVGMLGLKLLETSRPRDLMVLVFICYFLVVVNFLYSQEIGALLYSVPAIWVTTIALLQVSGSHEALAAPAAMRFSGLLILQALPLMLLLFLLFPRVPGPLWGLPARNEALSGLDDEMSPGSITSLSLSDEVAFTVRFDGAVPPPEALYWRGPVLHRFDGRTWRGGWRNYASEGGFEVTGQPWAYEVTLEPHNRQWLFALDIPSEPPRDKRMTFDFQLVNPQPVSTLMRYAVASYPQHRLDPEAGERLLAYERRLPEQRNPRTGAFARALLEQSSGPDDLIRRALSHFNREPFVYTLQPPPLDGKNPVDRFLFDSQQGFCEHYASAFANLMRAADIPARVVTGYLGGERNPITGHLTIRQSDAHAWTEVWLEDVGWYRVDPTAAVAPERVLTGLAGALPAGEPVPGLFMRSHRWLNNLRFGFDALNGLWNEFILGYGPEAQADLLSRMGFRDADWRALTLVLAVSFGLVSAFLAVMILRQKPADSDDPAGRLYRSFCRRVTRRTGIERGPGEAPAHFARRCALARPDLAADIAAITDCYLQARYAAGDPALPMAHLRTRLGGFRP